MTGAPLDTPGTPGTPFPTFTQWLAGLDHDELSALLNERPDALTPPPPTIASLAARLGLRASAARMLRTLNAAELAVIEVAGSMGAELEPIAVKDLSDAAIRRVPGLAAEETLHRVRTSGLLYGDSSHVRLAPEVMSALPMRVRVLRPELSGEVTTALANLTKAQRGVLTTLANAGGVGSTKDAAADADPARPIPQLIASGVLERISDSSVFLPPHIREEFLHPGRERRSPLPSERITDSPFAESDAKTDQQGAATGLEIVRYIELLIDHLGHNPAELLKSGGLGIRVTATIGKALGLEELETLRVIAVAYSAGLIAKGDALTPTTVADEWLALPLPERLSLVLAGWMSSPWQPWLVIDDSHSVRLFTPEATASWVVPLRRLAVEAYALAGPEVALSATEAADDLFFRHPIDATLASPVAIAALVEEAEWIGAITTRGKATTLARLLVAGAGEEEVIAAAKAVTPEPVTSVIPQADMTILVPGPLPSELRRNIEDFAALESSGLASVYRLTEASVRASLDAGWTAEAISTWLSEHSMGEVPEAMIYLAEDVARRHGHIRGGAAMSYLRCADEALLAAAARVERANLRLLAPTVAISELPLAQVIHVLRQEGFQPVAEGPDGATIDVRPEPQRIPGEAAPWPQVPHAEESLIDAAVRTLRASASGSAEGSGELAAGGIAKGGTVKDSDGAEATTTAEIVAVVESAMRGGRSVRVSFVDRNGQDSARVLKPLSVSAGQVDALDEATRQVSRVALHRIIGARMV